jgi:hypothetical protein
LRRLLELSQYCFTPRNLLDTAAHYMPAVFRGLLK